MGKHLQIVVPNYPNEGAPDGASAPLTLMRLGAAFAEEGEALDAEARGDDHLEEVEFETESHAWDFSALPARGIGAGFYRDDAAGAPEERTGAALTEELLTRGGVREHTDGNRISTTRGDVVEVVGGNYKLIVMGRVEGAHVNEPTAASWQSSGGIHHDTTSAPGAAETTSIRFSQTDGGTWEVTETTEKGDVHSTFIGRVEEVFTGPSRCAYVGHGGPTRSEHAARRPAITETVYARQIHASTHANRIDGARTIAGNLTENRTTAAALAAVYEWTDVTGSSLSTSVGTATEKVGSYTKRVCAGLTFAYEQFASKTTWSTGRWTNNIQLNLGAEVGVGSHLDLHFDRVMLGFNVAASFETAMAAKAECKIAPTLALKLGSFSKVAIEEHELDLVNMALEHALEHRIAAVREDIAFAQMYAWVTSVFG